MQIKRHRLSKPKQYCAWIKELCIKRYREQKNSNSQHNSISFRTSITVCSKAIEVNDN